MNKPRNLKIKLVGLAALTGLIAFILIFKPPCPIYSVLGFPCPTCGMTRAWICVFYKDVKNAFLLNPSFWTVPVVLFFAFFDFKPFKNKFVNGFILYLILFYVMVFYGVCLLYFFNII